MPTEFARLPISAGAVARAFEQLNETLSALERQSSMEQTVPVILDATDDNTNDEEARLHKADDCPCEAHKLARFEGSKLRHAVIHEYSYRPRGSWKLKNVGPDDPFKYYLGVELETDAHALVSGREEWSRVQPSMAADMRRPKNLWVPKHDGSVTGPEFASHPATLTYWQKHRKGLEDMFQMLLHAGYRSHDNDTCGMHVNISRSAFETPNHLFRFLTLIHANPKWALRMSQRSAASAAQWANVETLQDVTQRARIAGRSFHGTYSGLNRYTCLNAPRGESRFEFRLPRGTLRIDRFFKNLEWTVGMIEFTRNARITDSKPGNFMDWVRDQGDLYADLSTFIGEKFANSRALRDAVPVHGNVPENEDAMAGDVRDIVRQRYGGPGIYADGFGTFRYADNDRTVNAYDTYMGQDGNERLVLTGNRFPQPLATGRPQTYVDDQGVMRYVGGFRSMGRVRAQDTYTDTVGIVRWVLTDVQVR